MGRTRPSAVVVSEQAPRSQCSGRPSERDGDRAGRRGPRRRRIILCVAGGLLGPGYWVCDSIWDGYIFGKPPAKVHFAEVVLALAVVVVASWGLLLILGEALLFTLAVFRADDRERYDIYRNLMILWGYVLTLGIPRHFRRLPAQFGGLDIDRPGDACRREGAHHGRPREGAERRDRTERRDREGDRPGPRGQEREDRTGCREKAGRDRTGPFEQEREERTRCRKHHRTAAPERGDTRDRLPGPEAVSPETAASPGAAPQPRPEPAGPVGPIFPPRPAADILPATGTLPATDMLPTAETDLRDALDLLLRYAARFQGEKTVGAPIGIVAETGNEP